MFTESKKKSLSILYMLFNIVSIGLKDNYFLNDNCENTKVVIIAYVH